MLRKFFSKDFWNGRSEYHRMLFNTDYSFQKRFMMVLVYIGAPANIFFHYYEQDQGYQDSTIGRYAISLLLVTLVFLPKIIKQNKWQISYWELTLFIFFPCMNTAFMLMNHVNQYWFSTFILDMVFLGIFTKWYMIPFHYIFGSAAITWWYFHNTGYDAKLFQANLNAHVAAFLGTCVASGVVLTIEYVNKKSTEAKLALSKAEHDRLRTLELQKSNEELKKREEIIKVYVRPSLYEELAAGHDPLKFQPIMLPKAIMFCDIRDFTYLTEILTPYEKQTFLNQYFTLMNHAIVNNEGEVDKIVGDCIMGLFPNGRAAVHAALAMRKALHTFNNMMYNSGRRKIPNGIGIAKGEVMLGNFGSNEKLDRTVIGEAVNIASRLESKTKMYGVEIVVTQDVVDEMQGYPYMRWIDNAKVKGSSRPLQLYEIYGHQPDEVIAYKEKTKVIFEKALTIYFNKGFKDALRMFQSMLSEVPPHKYKANAPMDNILSYYIEHCRTWVNDSAGAWDLRNKWDGIHEFKEK